MTTRDRGGRAATGPLRAASGSWSVWPPVGMQPRWSPGHRPPRSRRGGIGRGSPGRCAGSAVNGAFTTLRDIGAVAACWLPRVLEEPCRRRAVATLNARERPGTEAARLADHLVTSSPRAARRCRRCACALMNAAASGSRPRICSTIRSWKVTAARGHPLVADEPPHRRQQQRADRPAGEEQRGVAAHLRDRHVELVVEAAPGLRLAERPSPALRDGARGVRSRASSAALRRESRQRRIEREQGLVQVVERDVAVAQDARRLPQSGSSSAGRRATRMRGLGRSTKPVSSSTRSASRTVERLTAASRASAGPAPPRPPRRRCRRARRPGRARPRSLRDPRRGPGLGEIALDGE